MSQPRAPQGVPTGGQFAASTHPEADVVLYPHDDLTCDECGGDMWIDDHGVSTHLTSSGDIDHDTDADHVAYQTDQATSPWDDNSIQFPRLIEEMQAAGLVDLDDPNWQAFYESTDLTQADVEELLDRAQSAWDATKASTGLAAPEETHTVPLGFRRQRP